MAADIGQEQFFQRMAQTPDRGSKRQPFNRDDVLHHFVARLRLRSHEPEPHHLRPTAGLVGDDAKKLAYLDAKPGFFDHLAPRAADWTLVPSELAAGQHPELVLAALNDRHHRPRTLA